MIQVFDSQKSPLASSWVWRELSGPDATDFLQRMSTLAAASVTVGQGGRACFLTATGKIDAAFWLWRLEGDRWGLEYEESADGESSRRLEAFIDKYTFAEAMTLTAILYRDPIWVFTAEETLDDQVMLESDRIVTQRKSAYLGASWQSIWGRGDAPEGEILSVEAMQERFVKEGFARLGRELTPDVNPLEIGLRDSISLKGCYPGQEVIEKIQSRGAVARRLCLIEWDGASDQSGELYIGEQLIGKVTSSAGSFALALVRKTGAKEGQEIRGKLEGEMGRILRVIE